MGFPTFKRINNYMTMSILADSRFSPSAAMSTVPVKKKRRLDAKRQPTGALAATKPIQKKRWHPTPMEAVHNPLTSVQASSVSSAHNGRIDPKVQQAKKFAELQAHRDGCSGMFKTFDSYFRNFLIPVIPTLSDLQF